MPESAVKKNVAAPTEISRDLAQHIAGLRYEDLPDYAVRAAKQFMLDTLAVAWAGSNSPGCADAHAMLADEGGRADGTVGAYGGKLPAPAAAFANSMFAAALDFDSLGRDAPSHVNIVVLPAALALAERRHVSGKEFLTALVAGSDLMCRLGVACESQGPSKGWFYTSVHGVFGSVAASARLMGLDAVGIRNAIGIAFSQAAGTQQANIEPSLTKRMQSGFASRSGVFAALLLSRDSSGYSSCTRKAMPHACSTASAAVSRMAISASRNFRVAAATTPHSPAPCSSPPSTICSRTT